MSVRVWKYRLDKKRSALDLPKGARFVAFGLDWKGDWCAWFEVHERRTRKDRVFGVFETGEEIPDHWVHVASVISEPGNYVLREESSIRHRPSPNGRVNGYVLHLYEEK